MSKSSICNSIRKIFLALLLPVGAVFSDVVSLTLLKPLINTAPTQGSDGTLSMFSYAIVNREIPRASSFFYGDDYQMAGYAIIFNREDSRPTTTLFLAKKRKSGAVIDNNPGVEMNFTNLFTYNSTIHTERQLVVAALSKHFLKEEEFFPIARESLSHEQAEQIIWKVDITQPFCWFPLVASVSDVSKFHGHGASLHVYVQANPCQNRETSNRGFSCIEYYNTLAKNFPNLDLHVYFPGPDMRLNREFFENNEVACAQLIAFLNKYPEFLPDSFSFEGEKLQRKTTQKGKKGKVRETTTTIAEKKDQQWSPVNFQMIIVNKLNNTISEMFSQSEREELFNNVHIPAEITNLKYHPINADVHYIDADIPKKDK